MIAPLALGIASGIVGLMSHMFVDVFNDRNTIQLAWLLMALVSSCEVIRRHEEAEHIAARTIDARP